MKYKVEITETLQKIVVVDANDEESALMKGRRLYREEKIVLDSSHHINTEVAIIH